MTKDEIDANIRALTLEHKLIEAEAVLVALTTATSHARAVGYEEGWRACQNTEAVLLREQLERINTRRLEP